MRWDALSVDDEATRQLPGYREPAAVRTFDAPEAMDIRFYEVRAKTALNRVPEASRMPFRWTVNPYRGCTHACVYCLDGTTEILLADGGVKPLAELRPGDRVVGTERVGARRRLSASDQLLGPGPGRPARAGDPVGTDRALWVDAIEALGEERVLFDITTGTGDFVANGVVSHNCFARPTHKYLDLSPGRDFEREIAPSALARTATAAAATRAARGRRGAQPRRNTDRRAGGAADAGHQRLAAAGRRDPRAGRRGERWPRRGAFSLAPPAADDEPAAPEQPSLF